MKHLFYILAICSMFSSCALLGSDNEIKFNRWEENLSINFKTKNEKIFYPEKSTVIYWISLTNLSKTDDFEGNITKEGKPRKAFVNIFFKLSDGGILEYKYSLDNVRIEPKKTTSKEVLEIPVPIDKNIISVEDVKIISDEKS